MPISGRPYSWSETQSRWCHARPVKKGESRQEIVEDLLDSAKSLVHVDEVLMDREFDSQHLLESIASRGLTYVVPKRMYISEKAQAKRLLRRDQDYYTTDRKLHLGKNEWHETTFAYERKKNSERTDHGQYAVFMTNAPVGAAREYSYRWEIESGYKSISASCRQRRRRTSYCGFSTSHLTACCTRFGGPSIFSFRSL